MCQFLVQKCNVLCAVGEYGRLHIMMALHCRANVFDCFWTTLELCHGAIFSVVVVFDCANLEETARTPPHRSIQYSHGPLNRLI